MKLLIVVSVAMLMFGSCINKKYLAKNQVIFKAEEAGKYKNKIKAYYTGNHKMFVHLQNINGTLFIEKDTTEKHDFVLPTVIVSSFDTSSKYQQLVLGGKYYFPETVYPLQTDTNSNKLFKPPANLKYVENHPVFQIITVPLKVRLGIANHRFKDSLPTQALAELNLGGAFGLKRTWTSFKAHPNDDGVSMVNTSFGCTGFISFGGTNVKPLTTRYAVPYEKTEYAVSYGVNFLFGFYNLNLGLSVGADRLLNQSIGDKWIFNGKVWYGVTVAYDVFR